MSSTIALVVFLGFILVGFTIEAKGRKNVTPAVWLPLFWMVICASRSIGQWLSLSGSNVGSEDGLDYARLTGSPVDMIVLSIAIAWGAFIIYHRRKATAGIFRNNKALLVFIIYLGITTLWSDIGYVSFKRWVRLFGNFVFAVVLITEPEPLESIKSMFRRAAYLLIPVSVMLVKYFPEIGVLYTRLGGLMWIGATVMKNGLGHLSFVMSFFLIWEGIGSLEKRIELKHSRILFDGIVLIMSLWLLKGSGVSNSAASMGCLIIGIAILIGSRMPVMKRNFGKIGSVVVSLTVLFLVLESSFGIVEIIVTAMGRNMTFTDRIPLWNILVDLGMKRPFIGYGYESFWINERSLIEGLNQAHNGYLEIFVEGGLVAIILLVVLLVSVFKIIQKSGLSNYKYAVFRLSFLTMILLANVTESSFARERDLLTFVFLIIALDYPPYRNIQTEFEVKPA